jgi:hypothetical protein
MSLKKNQLLENLQRLLNIQDIGPTGIRIQLTILVTIQNTSKIQRKQENFQRTNREQVLETIVRIPN